MKTNTLLLIAGAAAIYYFSKKKKKAAAAASAAQTQQAITKQATNPEAGDVTVIPLLAEPPGAVDVYVPTGWGPAWGNYRGGRGGGHRRGGHGHGHRGH